jgi:hypothetical protein
MYIGDSLNEPGGIGGSAGVGIRGNSPAKVLDQINTGGMDFSGRHIVLSSGISNGPSQIDQVQKQIDALQKARAASITLVGASPKFADANTKLQAMADAAGIRFVGLDPAEIGPDGVHPTARGYAALNGQVQPPTASPREAQVGSDVAAMQQGMRIARTTPGNALSLQSGPMSLDDFKKGILLAEHGGPGVVSPAGAMGRWQVMPGTARSPGLGLQGVDPSDPAAVDKLGEQYAEKLYEKYGPTMGAAAYNWGYGNVDKLIEKYGDPRKGQISIADWVSKLPNGIDPRTGKYNFYNDVNHYVNTVGGGQLALAGQMPPSSTATARDVGPGPGDKKSSIQMDDTKFPAPALPTGGAGAGAGTAPQQMDMQRFWTMAALQSLLPKGFGFHPVDYDPTKPMEVLRSLGGFRGLPMSGVPNLTQARPVGFDPGGIRATPVTAISPAGVPPALGRRRE